MTMQEKTWSFQVFDRYRPIFLHLDLHKLHLQKYRKCVTNIFHYFNSNRLTKINNDPIVIIMLSLFLCPGKSLQMLKYDRKKEVNRSKLFLAFVQINFKGNKKAVQKSFRGTVQDKLMQTITNCFCAPNHTEFNELYEILKYCEIIRNNL